MCKEIRMMIDSIAGCGTIFFFCLILIMIFLSIFSIFFVQGATNLLESEKEIDPEIVEELRKYFSSVAGGMLSLFQAVSGGDDWANFYGCIKELGTMYQVLFLSFISSYVIVLFNIITATFCEKAIHIAIPNLDESIAIRHEKEFEDAKELTRLMCRFVDDNGQKHLSNDQFDEFIKNP